MSLLPIFSLSIPTTTCVQKTLLKSKTVDLFFLLLLKMNNRYMIFFLLSCSYTRGKILSIYLYVVLNFACKNSRVKEEIMVKIRKYFGQTYNDDTDCRNI